MNKDKFLYDVFLTSETYTTRENTPIELYHVYLEHRVPNHMDTFLELGAQITAFVRGCQLPTIEPVFAKWDVWWCLKQDKLFGISLYSKKPHLTFCGVDEQMLTEIYPEYSFRPAIQHPLQWICRDSEVTVDDLYGLFEIRVQDFLECSETQL